MSPSHEKTDNFYDGVTGLGRRIPSSEPLRLCVFA
jgi:hypothetical protein